MEEAEVVYLARLNWVIFFWPVAFLCIALALGIQFEQFKQVALLFVVFAAIWIMITWVTYKFSSLTIKKKQVILRTGFLVRQTIDIPLGKIETIDIRQSIIGTLFRYGSLIITGTGGTRHMINFIDNPLTCRRYIEQLMHD